MFLKMFLFNVLSKIYLLKVKSTMLFLISHFRIIIHFFLINYLKNQFLKNVIIDGMQNNHHL